MVWLVSCLTLVLVLQPLAAQAKTEKGAPAPTLAGNVAGGDGDVSILGSVGSQPGGSPGSWYLGATPPNVNYSKPVLLFVHGKGGWAGVWWSDTVYHGVNDMYNYAYNNGYRTAFVDLYPNKDMYVNGQMLASLVNTVAAHFGVAKVDIIAHSKGGVDTDAALYYYGANTKVRRVITLGTPHWGTPIADMAYSSWTGWIADLMGEKNDATYAMQTGYMSNFRAAVNETATAPFYTLSGYKCGPVFTALWTACAFIGGEDDGLVSVSSARRPYSTHLKEGYWDHDEIRMGSRTWSWFSPVIQTASTPSAVAVGDLLAAASTAKTDAGLGNGQSEALGNVILRGGNTAQGAAPAFPLESGVRSATFTFMATSQDFTATLSGPKGESVSVTMQEQMGADGLFPGAWVGTATVKTPGAGSWSVDAAAGQEAGWFMVGELDSNLQATLDVGSDVSAPSAHRGLAVGFTGATPRSSQAEAVLSGKDRAPRSRTAFAQAAGKLQASVVPGQAGVHTVTVTVTGTMDDGSQFERTVVTSFAAGTPGQKFE
ncbi:MAG: putative lipase [Symbiobacteriaceae bacterium]|jgi:pimeloyl-ACP methyl ester carboxylesterase|nr:putative lipase [Symbiobacteriaceae bacterium]